MLRSELSLSCLGTTAVRSSGSDQSNSSASANAFRRFSFKFITHRRPNPIPIHHHQLNKYPFISSCRNFSHDHERFQRHPHADFFQASLLLSETVRHYHLRKQGFHEEAKQSSTPSPPFSAQTNNSRPHDNNDINTLGLAILRRFHSPTIFLKISCQGDFLLPIAVGEVAIEKLIDSLQEDDHGDYLNHFLFVRNIALDVGYEIKMVKIIRRVVNTYFARIYVGKIGEKASFSVNARPSDAINVARRCKAPIYVNKQIVLTDAIRIAYGTGRIRDTKPVYDVLLDSPMEGPDLLREELKLVHEMKVAVKEERYKDAAMCRDKLVKLRNSGP